jgi:hypothetical protein
MRVFMRDAGEDEDDELMRCSHCRCIAPVSHRNRQSGMPRGPILHSTCSRDQGAMGTDEFRTGRLKANHLERVLWLNANAARTRVESVPVRWVGSRGKEGQRMERVASSARRMKLSDLSVALRLHRAMKPASMCGEKLFGTILLAGYSRYSN